MKRNTLIFCIFYSVFCTSVFAKSDPWNGGMTMPAVDGNVYIVSTAEQLAWIANESQSNDFAGKIIRLTDDLDLGGSLATPPNWTPIGTESNPFKGELDGNIHVIYNLYLLSSLFPKGAGLFAHTAEEAVIHHLGMAQGQIMTDATNNIGSIAGVNKGTIHHCFNMLQIIAHNGDNVGGLVGANYGSISYAYNAGVITDANNHVGGLVGYNYSSAKLDNCYNMGFCKGTDHVGALFGKNEAPESKLTLVKFDQQLTRMYASGYGSNDPILTNNTKYAVELSSTFLSKKSPFYQNPETEWHYESGGLRAHAQLLCFKDHEASQVSVKAILLSEDLPVERAEGVATPGEKGTRLSFTLETITTSTGQGNWESPSPDIINIPSSTGEKANVARPCGNQEVILTLTFGNAKKQVYTNVKGYEQFDAGVVTGNVMACWNEEEVIFVQKNNGGKEPSGGKDDGQHQPNTCYMYMLIRDTVTGVDEFNQPNQFKPIDTVYLTYAEYTKWAMPTDVPGKYSFRRYVHDAQCRTEWTLSKGEESELTGRMHLTVRERFDAGELVEEPDTIYGVPKTLKIESERDASGGSGTFDYTWAMTRSELDTATQTWVIVPDDTRDPLYIGSTRVNTASFDYTFTQPGQYTFTRRVLDASCQAQPQVSYRPHIVIVYGVVDAGKIQSFSKELCSSVCTDTINEIQAPTGGNGIYSYRWLCNGIPIANSDTNIFLIENYPLSSNQTFVFTRQVKDNTGLAEWVTSEGEVSIRIYKDYQPGSIKPYNEQVCSDKATIDTVKVNIDELSAAQGEGESTFEYCWLLYRGGKDTTLLDTIHHNAPTIDTTILLSSYHLTMPVTVFMVREVKNLLCQSQWKRSANSSVWRFGRSAKERIEVKVCVRDLPYDYIYTKNDGSDVHFNITDADQSLVVNDVTEEGCPKEVTLVSVVTSVPEVKVEPLVSVCESTDSIYLQFEILQGSPDHFDLTFSEEAKEQGFRDSINAVLPSSGVISIPMPPLPKIGKLNMSIVFFAEYSSSEECKRGVPVEIPFSIDIDGFIIRKGNDVVLVDNSGKGDERAITFTSYQWYRNNELLEGETGQFYYEYNGLNGFYQVVMIGSDGTEYRSCVYELRPLTPIDKIQGNEVRGTKVIENGVLYLKYEGAKYDVMGRKVN